MFTPLSVSSLAPCFTRLEVPLTTPPRVDELNTFNEVTPAIATLPLKVSVPRFTKSPKVTVPDITTAFEAVRDVVESLEIRPPVAVSVPVPSAALFPSWIAPLLKLTPPLKVLLPVRVKTDEPFFTSIPAPLMVPE